MDDMTVIEASKAAATQAKLFGLRSFVGKVAGCDPQTAAHLIESMEFAPLGAREFIGEWDYKGDRVDISLVKAEDGVSLSVMGPPVWEPA